jgi:carboxylesterase
MLRPADTIPDCSFRFPAGPTAVLLIHGLTGTPTEMKGIGKGMARAGYTVHGVQLSGHCGSERQLVATGWRDWYASVVAAFDDLRRNHDRVFVAGLSMGALLALKLAADRPDEVAGIGLYSTTLFYDGWSVPRHSVLLHGAFLMGLGRFLRFNEQHPHGIKDDRLRERVVAAMVGGRSEVAGLLAMPGSSLNELIKLIRTVKKRLPEIRVPALVVHAREDDVTSPRNASYLAARLGGYVEKVILDDCYHMITLDRQRQAVIDHSIAFMRRFATPAAGPAHVVTLAQRRRAKR